MRTWDRERLMVGFFPSTSISFSFAFALLHYEWKIYWTARQIVWVTKRWREGIHKQKRWENASLISAIREDGICNQVHRSIIFIHHIVANAIVLFITALSSLSPSLPLCMCVCKAFICAMLHRFNPFISSILIIITIDNNNNDDKYWIDEMLEQNR